MPCPSTRRALVYSLLLTAVVALPGLSPAQDLDKEVDKPSQVRETDRMSASAASQASAHKALEGDAPISFDQVLADPDNIDLNYRYAKQQVRVNDLKGAAATLERILLIKSNLPKVRLFYAIVLYRLDILPESLQQLSAVLETPGVPADLKAEIRQYQDLIRKRLRRTNVSTRFSLGFQYDTNRNAAPNNGYRMFANQPVRLTSGLKTDDTSLLGMARVALTHDLGTQSGHNLFADYDYYRADQNKLHNIDFQAHSWRFGGTYKWQKGSLAPSAVFNYATLGYKTYLRTRGVSFDYVRRINNRLNLTAGLSSAFQEFIPNVNAPTADERTGQQTDLSAGLDYMLDPKNRVYFSFTHTDKDARRRYMAFQREAVRLTHARVLGKGTFLLTSLSYNADLYREAERAVYGEERIDNVVRMGPTLGVPLGLAHPSLKDLLWTVGYEFMASDSNVISYDYHDHKINTMLTYRWDL